MGLFDAKPKDIKSSEKNTSGETQDAAKQNSIRNLSGFSSIEEVREAARTAVEGGSKEKPGTVKPTSTRSAKQRASAEEAAKEEQRQLAMAVVGKHIMGKVASLPYDVWAKIVADDHMLLSPQEHKELTDAYYLLAQTVHVDFSKPVFLFLGIGLNNFVLVAERLKYMSDKEQAESVSDIPEEGKQPN